MVLPKVVSKGPFNKKQQDTRLQAYLLAFCAFGQAKESWDITTHTLPFRHGVCKLSRLSTPPPIWLSEDADTALLECFSGTFRTRPLLLGFSASPGY